MLDSNRQQRSVLAEKLADTANLAVAGMVVGQTLSGEPFSPLLAVLRIGHVDGVPRGERLADSEGRSVSGYFILFGGMLAFAAFFVIVDWLNERRDRRSHHTPR